MAITTRARSASPQLGLGSLWPRLFAIAALLLALFLAAAAFVEVAYGGRAVPGLRVGGVDVGALEPAAIRERLTQRGAALDLARAHLTLDGREVVVTNAELGLVADVDRSVEAALRFGRSGSPLTRLDAWLDAVAGRASLELAMRAEGDAATAWIAVFAERADRPPVNARIERTSAGLIVTESAAGRRVDRDRLLAVLLEPSASSDRVVGVPVQSVAPPIDSASSLEALALARATAAGLEVTAGDRGVIEDPAGLASLVWTELVGDRYLGWVREDRVRDWAAKVAALLDRPARDATYRLAADGSYEVVPGHDGVRIHQDTLVRAVVDALRGAHGERIVVAAPMTTEQPRFTTADATRYQAQLAPVASFRTAFPVDRARYTNIRIGASFFDGVVVAPGDELSFWSVFGNDPGSKGFVPAGAIINGISDNSVVGGGLCQVSTTLFNAAALAGYEIVERHPHSYLIERYPTGLDAAVLFPGADMRWRNDTQYPVLIRSVVTPTSVTFTLVSVPTGRTVMFTGPAQSRWVPVTADLPPDPGHAAGYKVDGRDVVRVRTVTEGDTVVHRDVFFSRYAPVWGGPSPE